MSEKQSEQLQAAQKAWDEWHASVGFADDDDYFPADAAIVASGVCIRSDMEHAANGEGTSVETREKRNLIDIKRKMPIGAILDERAEFFGDIPAPMAKEGVKFDTGKRRVDLVPTEAINALADILTAGAAKYGSHNWRKGMAWSRVYGAAQRHMLAFWGGDDIDEESGMPHLWHALTNVAFLVSYQAMSVGRDDRWKGEDDRP